MWFFLYKKIARSHEESIVNRVQKHGLNRLGFISAPFLFHSISKCINRLIAFVFVHYRQADLSYFR